MRPQLVLNPTTDLAFAALANDLASDSPAGPGALESALRARYPKAVVHARELSSETDRWYVYRDGSWTPGR